MKTMKKLAYLLGLMMVLSIGFTSCEKDGDDDPIVNPVVLNQPTDYFGTWTCGNGTYVIGKNTIANTIGTNVNLNVVNWSVDVAETAFTTYKDTKGTVIYNTKTIIETPTNVDGKIEMVLEYVGVESTWVKQ